MVRGPDQYSMPLIPGIIRSRGRPQSLGMGPDGLEALLSGLCGGHRPAVLGEDPGAPVPHDLFVVNHQDGFLLQMCSRKWTAPLKEGCA